VPTGTSTTELGAGEPECASVLEAKPSSGALVPPIVHSSLLDAIFA